MQQMIEACGRFFLSAHQNAAAGDAVRQEIARGGSAAIPAVPFTRYGGVLTGWNTAADGTSRWYKISDLLQSAPSGG